MTKQGARIIARWLKSFDSYFLYNVCIILLESVALPVPDTFITAMSDLSAVIINHDEWTCVPCAVGHFKGLNNSVSAKSIRFQDRSRIFTRPIRHPRLMQAWLQVKRWSG